MIVLSAEQIRLLHSQLIQETGGIDGVRDIGLLESAVNAPLQSFDGIDMYPSVQQKAARLGFGLIKKHAFIDGNKRIGAHAMLVFLALNRISLCYTQEELIQIILQVAAGEADFQALLAWVIEHQS